MHWKCRLGNCELLKATFMPRQQTLQNNNRVSVNVIHILRTASEQDQDGTPSRSCSQAVSKYVWHIPLLYVQRKTPDDGQRNCLKHVKFYFKYKFAKLVHLVGFTIRMQNNSGHLSYQPLQSTPCTECLPQVSTSAMTNVGAASVLITRYLIALGGKVTFWRQNNFFNFRTLCI